MPKLILNDIGSFSQDAITTINQNNNRIEAALENTLSRNGTIPNQLESDLDLNHNNLLNISNLEVESVTIGDTPLTEDQMVLKDDLGPVAFSNDYNDLDNLPSILTDVVTSVNGRRGDVTLSQGDVGLGNVNNTSDLSKPISALTQLALNGKFNNPTGTTAQYIRGDGSLAVLPSSGGTVSSVGLSVPAGLSVSGSPITTSGTFTISYASGYQGYTTTEANKLSGIESGAQANTVTSVAGKTGAVTLTKTDVGLGNVDNTTDLNKPISTLTQAALNDKANSSVTITAGTGLTGGGTIAGNRTIALSSTSIASLALADSAVQASDLGDLALIDFPAVPSGNVLNDTGNWVPQGGGGSGGQVNSVVAGSGITVDSTDPTNPIVSAISGGGTVTSVSLSVPTGLSVSGSPITTSGTFAISYASGYRGFLDSDKTKLDGISSGATSNSPDATLLNRANHTGTQAISTVSGLQDELDGKFSIPTGTTSQYIRGNGTLATFPSIPTGTVTTVGLSAPTGFTVSGSPVTSSGTLTFSYSAGYRGYTTTEANKLSGIEANADVTDSVNVASAGAFMKAVDDTDDLVEGDTNIFFTVTERGKLTGIATNATANSPDATLLARANHTGTQSISTISGLQTALDGKAGTTTATTSVNGLMSAADKTKLDLVGTMANRNVTISTSDPTGGSDGDIWLKYIP